MSNIRNFCIIAHIDSGKSTLADRFLELTGTVPPNKMRPQYLDKMELERERGITIKLAPVRMRYRAQIANSKERTANHQLSAVSHPPNSEYILNLIDTPGHSDFSYEVSRALTAVEGAILLVDGTKGVQAQTLSNLRAAQKAGLKFVGAVNKADLNPHRLEEGIKALAQLLNKGPRDIHKISAKTGEGVSELLDAVIADIPAPKSVGTGSRALIFDSMYDDHKGIIAFVRVFAGKISVGDSVALSASSKSFKVKEVGYFVPEFRSADTLSEGEIGYIATGLKEAEAVRTGDTVVDGSSTEPLPGYREPGPVVFISFYPDGKSKFEDLKKGIEKLRLSDPALSVEPEANEALGRGLKIGFLGQLHFEIISSRLSREFGLEFLTSFPTIAYRVAIADQRGTNADIRGNFPRESASGPRQSAMTVRVIKQPQDFPDNPDKEWQPIIKLEILVPKEYLSAVSSLKNVFDLEILEVETLGDNTVICAKMPLAELIRDFDDKLKSASAGYASFSYELAGEEEADVTKLEILIVGDVVPALTRIVAEKDLEREARQTVERLKELLPKQQFVQAIQAKAHGRIIARETIPAMKKLLGNFGKTGGDRTRKMKLWKKQAKGKEKLQSMARVEISPETFREILKK